MRFICNWGYAMEIANIHKGNFGNLPEIPPQSVSPVKRWQYPIHGLYSAVRWRSRIWEKKRCRGLRQLYRPETASTSVVSSAIAEAYALSRTPLSPQLIISITKWVSFFFSSITHFSTPSNSSSEMWNRCLCERLSGVGRRKSVVPNGSSQQTGGAQCFHDCNGGVLFRKFDPFCWVFGDLWFCLGFWVGTIAEKWVIELYRGRDCRNCTKAGKMILILALLLWRWLLYIFFYYVATYLGSRMSLSIV